MSISQTQKRGYIWLLSLLIVLLLVVIFWPTPKPTDNTAVADTLKEDSIEQPYNNTPHKTTGNNKRYPRYTHSNNHTSDSSKTNQSIAYNEEDKYTPAPKKEPLIVRMNSADSLTWQLLYGIGPSYSKRIVKYRELLGGYIRKEQLMEVYGFSKELYESIEPHIICDEVSIRRMKINEIPLKELSRHPYIDYYQARDIVDYRNRGHLFLEPTDLLAIPTMDTATLQRLMPYLDFEIE